jgi:hypothetical protein
MSSKRRTVLLNVPGAGSLQVSSTLDLTPVYFSRASKTIAVTPSVYPPCCTFWRADSAKGGSASG